MEWTDLIVTAQLAGRAQLEAATEKAWGAGYYMEDYSDLEEEVLRSTPDPIIDDDLLALPRDIVRLHLYLAPGENAAAASEKMRSALLAAGVEHTLASGSVAQEDWENAWKQYYHPIEIGTRLAVAPSWEEYRSPRVTLRMDPGMAFGTGTHETTYMCLEWLDELVRGGETLLDIGTGSGVLAVAALLLGAGQATGIDIDALSIRIAAENAARNGVQSRFIATVGDLASQTGGAYDFVCANIVAAAITRLAPDVPRLLAPGGLFIASGIIAEREAEVLAALKSAGLRVTGRKQQKEWVALLAQKESGIG